MSLAGLRVVVTRAEGEGKLSSALEELGAVVLHVPTIAIEPPEDTGALDDALALVGTGRFDVVAFTSVNGVEGLLGRAAEPARALRGARVAAVGSRTADALEGLGISVDLVPDSYTGESLAEALGPGPGRVLLPRAEVVPPTMSETLRRNGWEPTEVVAYRTVPAEPTGPDADAVRSGVFDVATFTSASTVEGFVSTFGAAVLGGKAVACIGPVTAAAAETAGLKVDVVAEPHTVEGLVDALRGRMGR